MTSALSPQTRRDGTALGGQAAGALDLVGVGKSYTTRGRPAVEGRPRMMSIMRPESTLAAGAIGRPSRPRCACG